MDFDEMARWYDGYSFRQVQHVYNPNSVVNAIMDGEYDSYWSNTASYESLREYISMNFEGLRDLVVQMFSGARCTMDIGTFQNDMTSFKSRDDVLTALIIELKYGESAESAVVQIRERQYPEALKDYRGNMLLVGISYDRESKKHFCIIEEQEKK